MGAALFAEDEECGGRCVEGARQRSARDDFGRAMGQLSGSQGRKGTQCSSEYHDGVELGNVRMCMILEKRQLFVIVTCILNVIYKI